MFDLTGKTALVTGATGGIGGAIAQALHAQGATVAISGTRREVLDGFAARLGERVHVLPCNLSSKEDVEALVPAAEAAMGQVDILIANAGITRDNLFVQLRDEDWDDVIAVNLTATFRLARAATKLMMRKRFGRIIAITSNPESTMAKLAETVVTLENREGADPGNVIAMGSTLVTAVWGDALAILLMRQRGYSWDQMLETHPGGAVGKLNAHPEELDPIQ